MAVIRGGGHDLLHKDMDPIVHYLIKSQSQHVALPKPSQNLNVHVCRQEHASEVLESAVLNIIDISRPRSLFESLDAFAGIEIWRDDS